MKRFLVGGAILVVLLIGVGSYLLFNNLEFIIKTAVEKVGSNVAQVEVRLDEVAIELGEGKVEFSGLFVGNPKGFEADSVFELGSIRIQVDRASLNTDVIVIKELAIINPIVTYEIGSKGSNVQALQRNVQSSGKDDGGTQAEESASESGGKKFVIERLLVDGGQINLSSTLLKGKSMTANLATIELRDVGKKGGGMSSTELAALIINVLSKSAAKSASTLNLDALSGLPGDVTDLIPESMNGEAIKKTTDKLMNLLK